MRQRSYDIEEKSYDYYIHETNDNEQKYSKISENIKIKSEQENIEQDLTGYIVKEGEIISVTTLEGKKLEISKYDKKFIKTNLVENRWTAINLNTYEEEIKKKLSNALKEMKKELTEKEMEKVSEKEIEIQTTKQEMVKAIEEIEQKQKEEEERKKAEEEARIKAEEEAKKKAEEEAKKAEEEAKKIAEEKKRQEESQARKLHIKIWNI